jgi:type II restriction enzyme
MQQTARKVGQLQVVFDKAYIISFADILKLVSKDENEGKVFSIERDVKNQMKTTIKINVMVGREIIGKIDMPQHKSAMKELARGRLLFYVTFEGGKGYLDKEVFLEKVIYG